MLEILILQKNIQKELQNDKKVVEKLNYDEIEFPVQEKDFNKIEVKNSLCINVMKISWFFEFMFQIKNLKTQ